MNIFALDPDPMKCARYHCDKHVGKMALESTQLLFNGYWALSGHSGGKPDYFTTRNMQAIFEDNKIYAPTHWNHPCSQWVISYRENWLWTMFLGYYLCGEYQKRFNKEHACLAIIQEMMDHPPELPNTKNGKISMRPQAMPDEYKIHKRPIAAYRLYYIGEKSKIARWERGVSPPTWYIKNTELYKGLAQILKY
jgi:hypothetical protein